MIKLLMNQRLRQYHGVDCETVFSGIGEQIGHALARKMTATELAGIVRELIAMWEDLNLGYIEVVETSPLIFKLRECYACLDYSKDTQKAFLAFDRTLLQTIFQDRLGHRVDVNVTETYRENASHCLYEIHPIEPAEIANPLPFSSLSS